MEEIMDKLSTMLAGLVLIAIVFFLAPLVGVLVGAFSGWVVGLFFPTTFNVLLAAIGLGQFAVWQLGAALGFVGGFLQSSSSSVKR